MGDRYLAIDHHPVPWHAPVGPIHGRREVVQSFISRQDNLAGLDIYLGTYGRTNQGQLTVSLRAEEAGPEPLFQERFEMAGLRDNAPLEIRFEPLAGLQGRRLNLCLAAPESDRNNGVAVWANNHLLPAQGGRLAFGEETKAGAMAFRTWFAGQRPPMPQMLYVELTNRCNIRCIHCFWEERRESFEELDPVLLERIEPVMGRAGLVLSGNEGEMLYPDELGGKALDFLLTGPEGYSLHLTTNATMLEESIIRRLVTGQRVARLFFSIDGATRSTYNKIRRGADLPKVLTNIKAVAAMKRGLGLPSPGLGLTMVGMRRNIEELPTMIELAAEVGADLVTFLPLIVGHPKLAGESLHNHPELSNEMMAKAREKAASTGIAIDLPEPFTQAEPRRGHKPCWRPWTFAFIGSNGDVLSCCNPASVMGNLHNQAFDEIWFGERYERLREALNTDRDQDLCRDCPDHNFRLIENPYSYFSCDPGLVGLA